MSAAGEEEIALIPNLRGGYLKVTRRRDRMIIGGRELDLEGMAALMAAVDECVRQIRVAEGDDDA